MITFCLGASKHIIHIEQTMHLSRATRRPPSALCRRCFVGQFRAHRPVVQILSQHGHLALTALRITPPDSPTATSEM